MEKENGHSVNNKTNAKPFRGRTIQNFLGFNWKNSLEYRRTRGGKGRKFRLYKILANVQKWKSVLNRPSYDFPQYSNHLRQFFKRMRKRNKTKKGPRIKFLIFRINPTLLLPTHTQNPSRRIMTYPIPSSFDRKPRCIFRKLLTAADRLTESFKG